MKRLCLVLFAGVITMVVPSTPALARPAAPVLTLTPNVGPPTFPVKAKGTGYPPGHQIVVSFDSTQVATAVSGSTGKFTAKFKVPSSAVPGNHIVGAYDPNQVGASAVFLVRVDWANPRYNAQNWGFDPYENVLNPANVAQLGQISAPQWGAFLHSGPIYAGGMLVAGSDDGTVRAFDPTSGAQRWSFDAGGPVLGSPVAVQRNPGPGNCAIVAGSQDGNLYGVDPVRGTQLWTASLGAPMSSSPVALVPVVQKGGADEPASIVYQYDIAVVPDDGSVHVFDGCTGAPLWSESVEPGVGGLLAFQDSIVLLDGSKHDLIIVGFADGSVVALDASTGDDIWTMKEPAPILSPATYGSGLNGRIVLAAGPSIVELNASTGAEMWRRTTAGPASGVGLSFVPSMGGPGAPAAPALRLSLRAVIATDQMGDVYALNPKNGSPMWTHAIPPDPCSPPSIANGVVYVERAPGPGGDGQVIGLNASTGDPLFQINLGDLNPQPLPPFPAIADGRIYVGDFTGGVRVFGLQG